MTCPTCAARTVVIPNGFDEDDFAGVPPPPAADGRFHLAHMGTFHPADAPEGFTANSLTHRRHRQIARLGRSGYYLLHALADLRQRCPDVYSRLCVELYGRADDTHRALGERLGVGTALRVHGYVPHAASIAALRAADAAFVPLHDVPAGERALVVPGKLYEALASERPVLAAVPPGDAADLVIALDAGVVVPPTDAAQMSRALEGLVRAHAAGSPRSGCARAALAMFTRRHLTSLLAGVVAAAAGGATRFEPEDPWAAVARLRGTSGRPETA